MSKVSISVVLTVCLISATWAAHAAKKEVYARYLTIDGPAWMTANGFKEWHHTYACEETSGGTKRCYSRTGRSEQGSKLSGTTSHEENTNVKCVFDYGKKGDSCWVNQDESNYLKRKGTCHQETNHGLRTGAKGGPTVSKAKGYALTRLVYGTYGKDGLEESCKKVCKK